MSIRIPPTDTPCPAFGVGCGGFLDEDGVCRTCGAVVKPADRRRDPVDEVIDESFETDPYASYTDASLDALADEAADRYYNRD